MAAKAQCVAHICRTFLSWPWTLEQSPPRLGSPQVTTLPSARMAAQAERVPEICRTFLSRFWTPELSPPYAGFPHVTTVPGTKIAAKALCVAELLSCRRIDYSTPCGNSITPNTPHGKGKPCCSYLWLCNSGNAVSILKPRTLKIVFWIQQPPGAASLKKPIPNECCAALFRSAMVPCCETATVSHRPLGKETSSLMWSAGRRLLGMAHPGRSSWTRITRKTQTGCKIHGLKYPLFLCFFCLIQYCIMILALFSIILIGHWDYMIILSAYISVHCISIESNWMIPACCYRGKTCWFWKFTLRLSTAPPLKGAGSIV